jgi:hypothetical protein
MGREERRMKILMSTDLIPAEEARRQPCRYHRNPRRYQRSVGIPGQAEPGILQHNNNVAQRRDFAYDVHRPGQHLRRWPRPTQYHHDEKEYQPYSLGRTSRREHRPEEKSKTGEAYRTE